MFIPHPRVDDSRGGVCADPSQHRVVFIPHPRVEESFGEVCADPSYHSVVLIPHSRVEEGRGGVCADPDPLVVLHSKGGSSSQVSLDLTSQRYTKVTGPIIWKDFWPLTCPVCTPGHSHVLPEDLLGMEEASSLGSSGDFDSFDESSFVVTHHIFSFDSIAVDL